MNSGSFSNANAFFGQISKIENKYQSFEIENWRLFENGDIDFGQEDYYEFFLSDVNVDQQVFLVTHEGVFNRCFFRFLARDFIQFSDWYEDCFSMEFFQLSYYLLIFPGLKMVRFLDDYGKIHQFTL
jgi:hypothetical protein